MDTKGRGGAKLVQRGIQTLSLGLFLWLLWNTVSPLPEAARTAFLPVDAFLRLDPLMALAVPLAARDVFTSLAPGLAVIVSALLFGRLFCGYVCPMGATLDAVRFLTDRFLGRPARPGKARTGTAPAEDTALERETPAGNAPPSQRAAQPRAVPAGLRRIKYGLLFVVLGAALAGVNLFFWVSPIPLITRFYALLAHPLLTLAGNEAVGLARPLLDMADLPALNYFTVGIRRYDSLYFLLFFFGALFSLERIRPRFWCRYLCPAGAVLALASFRPVWRRRVHACTQCGMCAKNCPTGAIAPPGNPSSPPECVTCRACTGVCPVQGVTFSLRSKPAPVAGKKKSPGGAVAAARAKEAVAACRAEWGLPRRRAFLAAAGAGGILAMAQLSGSRSLLLAGGGRGIIWPAACIRPPGALPEPAFLDRCVRCGQCMKVCPTGGLQPAWLEAGPESMFSPVLVSRRGPCEPDCNACGRVCPTGAITPLPLEEKHWAKVGTALVIQGRCVAWSEGKRCVVCQEVCPYGAVDLIQNPGARVPVPVVRPSRCFGCGYCEQHCPVLVTAIMVEPLNALRLAGPEYRKKGGEAGLDLVPGHRRDGPDDYLDPLPEGALPPGFSQ